MGVAHPAPSLPTVGPSINGFIMPAVKLFGGYVGIPVFFCFFRKFLQPLSNRSEFTLSRLSMKQATMKTGSNIALTIY